MNLKPVVLFDKDNEMINRKSSIKPFSSLLRQNKDGLKEKPYVMKYNVLKIRQGEIFDQWDCQSLDISQYCIINLKVKSETYNFKQAMVSNTSIKNPDLPTLQQYAFKNTLGQIISDSNVTVSLTLKKKQIMQQSLSTIDKTSMQLVEMLSKK